MLFSDINSDIWLCTMKMIHVMELSKSYTFKHELTSIENIEMSDVITCYAYITSLEARGSGGGGGATVVLSRQTL